MSNTVKKVKQTCTCKDCGNESEMVITCTLEDIHEHTGKTPSDELYAPAAANQNTLNQRTTTTTTKIVKEPEVIEIR